MNARTVFCLCAGTVSGVAPAQVSTPRRAPTTTSVATMQAQTPPADLGPTAPLTLTLQDAQTRAQMNAPQLLAAISDTNLAREDLKQARASLRPSASFKADYLGTQGNGKLSESRFVTNDGVHVYRDWGVVREDLTAALTRTTVQRASEAESIARAKADIARRGLAMTVAKAYYALLTGQHKYATAQQALDQAKRYLDISRSLEKGGEVAHSDTVKAELQYTAQEQTLREAKLSMDTARLDVAVLLFRDFDQNFTLVDDLNLPPTLPPLNDIRTMAERENPDLRAASGALRAATTDVALARQAYLPSLTADLAYGIEANAFAFHSTVAAAPEKGSLPNLGYFLTLSLNVPVFDWGTRASKVRQAVLKRDQASVELTAAQRESVRNLQGFYQEAQTAREQVDSLRHSVDLASESLRLNGLRYEAGEASILELVDAQTTLMQARNAYDEGQVRYRLAIANLQSLTGPF
jgi:outer membrane protein TolC